jgi:hypothetical protein
MLRFNNMMLTVMTVLSVLFLSSLTVLLCDLCTLSSSEKNLDNKFRDLLQSYHKWFYIIHLSHPHIILHV